MELYIARDISGIRFFKDCPDLVRFSADSPIEWTGYPVNFGDFPEIKTFIEQSKPVQNYLNNFDDEEIVTPLRLKIEGLKIKAL